MPTFQDSYVGHAKEVTYGTFVAPAVFSEFNSEGIQGKYERIESEALRAGNKVLRADRWAVNPKGAEGDLKVECMDTGLNNLLEAGFGGASSAAPAGGFTVSTYVLGNLLGKALSVKVGRVDSGGTMRHFDYSGGKVKSFELSNAVDGILMLSADLDFAKETVDTASATPTYSALSTQLLTYVSGTVTVGGTAFAASDVSIKVENSLKTDRYALRGANSTTKREPLVEGLREVSFDIKGEFEDLSHYNRMASATVAGATASLALTWDSPQGGQLTVTIPAGRFDEAPVNVDGAKVVEQSLQGKALFNGTDEPITVTYKAKSA